MKKYKEELIDDNMLHQIQRLLAHLELSERNDYNPIGFTFSFKEFDGGPTNISEQKDAQEFLIDLKILLSLHHESIYSSQFSVAKLAVS